MYYRANLIEFQISSKTFFIFTQCLKCWPLNDKPSGMFGEFKSVISTDMMTFHEEKYGNWDKKSVTVEVQTSSVTLYWKRQKLQETRMHFSRVRTDWWLTVSWWGGGSPPPQCRPPPARSLPKLDPPPSKDRSLPPKTDPPWTEWKHYLPPCFVCSQ